MTTKKEKPIIFSTPMVKAILAGHKTMTRRVLMPPPVLDADGMWTWRDCQWMDGGIGFPESGIADYAPYRSGDILWARETWSDFFATPDEPYIYKADEERVSDSFRWNPPIFMPREAARIFLKVINVRIERLREITAEDKVREGFCDCCRSYPCVEKDKCDKPCFMKLWDALNKKRGYGWDSNPWVWVIEFKRISELLGIYKRISK